MNNLYSVFSGIVIGAGVVLPGVSGSVLAIMLGIYDKVIYLLNDNSSSIIKKIKEILPLLIGLLIGIILFGNLLLFFFERYEVEMRYVFIGLILGGIPILNNEIKNKSGGKVNYKCLLITLIFSTILFILSNYNFSFSSTNFNNIPFIGFLTAGILYISGKIIPGISSSFFMMILGLYDYILLILSNPFSFTVVQYIKFIPFIIGVIAGFMILVKLINYLLSNHFTKTYSSIIGFVLGSVFAIFPGIKLEFSYFISFLLMILSFILAYNMSKK